MHSKHYISPRILDFMAGRDLAELNALWMHELDDTSLSGSGMEGNVYFAVETTGCAPGDGLSASILSFVSLAQ